MFREDERMEEHHAADDQSHYEISLTAGQAFVAFVLLLLSLAAAFAFGLMIGKGQSDDRLVVQKPNTPVVTEASMAASPKKSAGEIVELGVPADDFEEPAAKESSASTETAEAGQATVIEEAAPPAAEPAAAVTETPASTPAATSAPAPATSAPVSVPASQKVATYAQLLSTGDQKTAEKLAVRLIERGYTSAYVERGASDKGPIYRVRVKFNSDAEAQSAKPKLQEFSKEVWITSR
jgi:hypothetical protein